MNKKNLFLTLLISFNLFAVGKNYEVQMLNQGSEGYMVFEPAVIKIQKGDSVTFKATDAAHNSASIDGMIPAGAKVWNSKLSQDITVTFNVDGIYGYQCTPHAMMAMIGLIQVGENKDNLESVKAAAQKFKATFVMNQDRFDNYLSQL
ncbi:MAG: pseudoazurin [Proteobacteria bacterium]|uniref:Pseudoazurin n=1 Tax=SAR86 cluster bacterium TaxID=2030880 RepID=A0A937LJF3_9GAMM|nr:pseudoazurin [SAR86 cluster bacterium]MDA0774964.1 pseudoazurin [Pseudomonadota bacterium]MDA0975828.1 pseudoazurin [Pseudomonadota bacterium]MDA1037008.1 pseudoazurin [Pseudomonadota bacterium]